MAHVVVWSPRAIDDVDSIAAYIAEDSEGCQNFLTSDALFMNLTMRRYVRSLPTVTGLYIESKTTRSQ